MQHRCRGHDGWLQYLPELRRFEVRMRVNPDESELALPIQYRLQKVEEARKNSTGR
jgi:hypothetical protein